MAKKTAKKPAKKTTTRRAPTAAQLHEQARVARRAGEAPEVVEELLERARDAERAAR